MKIRDKEIKIAPKGAEFPYKIYEIAENALEGVKDIGLDKTENVRRFSCKREGLDKELLESHTNKDGAVIFDAIYAFAPKEAEKIIIPSEVECIGMHAFDGCCVKEMSVVSATDGEAKTLFDCLPDTVEILALDTYGNEQLDCKYISGCLRAKRARGEKCSLSDIKISEYSNLYKDIDGIVYSANGETLFFCPPAKSGKIRVADGTKRIADSAFEGSKAEAVLLPDSVEEIGAGAFFGSAVKEIVLPASIKNVGKGSLSGITSLKMEHDKPIQGLLEALDIYSGPIRTGRAAGESAILMDIGGHRFALPSWATYEGLNAFRNLWDSGVLDKKAARNAWRAAATPEMAGDCALAQYQVRQKGKKLKKFLKKHAGRMAERYEENGEEERMMAMEEMGLIGKSVKKQEEKNNA